MKEKKYASLHAHTEYSNLKIIDSINKVEELIDTAYEKGLKAIAITDHDTLSGHVRALKHYKKYKKAWALLEDRSFELLSDEEIKESGLDADFIEKLSERKDFKLILGNEIYLTREGLEASNYEKGEKFYHLVLLAKDKEGHKQLREVSSRAWNRMFVRGGMRTPTYLSDLKDIIKDGHVVCSTACLGGIPGRTFAERGEEEAIAPIRGTLNKLQGIFGEENFYVELQPSFQRQQVDFNSFMIDNFWDEYPFIFTTDAHYLKEEDKQLHETFLKSKQAEREVAEYYSAAFLMDYEEVLKYFDNTIDDTKIEDMAKATLKIAEMVEEYDLAHKQIVPSVPTEYPTGTFQKLMSEFRKTDYEYIIKYIGSSDRSDLTFIYKVFQGFDKLDLPKDKEYLERLNVELEQLWGTSEAIEQPISNYFLTMAKMIDIIWDEADSLVGVSRGSAAGFLVNYCLGITQIDPLRQELEMPYWRFMHKDRPDLPDIDIDTEGNKRKKVFNKVREYFKSIGGDVINVSTFGTEKAKSALRTASRGLNVNDDVVSHAISLIPNERGFDWTLQQCMHGDDTHQPVKGFQKIMSENKELWEVSSGLEGLVTSIGVHAAGVIPVNESFTEHNSLMRTSRGVVVSAYDLGDTEYLGGLKYDFLTVNALDKIRTTLNLLMEDEKIEWKNSLRETYNYYLLPKNLLYDKKEMWEMVHNGNIVDLFQFDTAVGGQAVKSIKPEAISELAIANSLMRLMKQENADEMPAETYIRNKNDIRNWEYELNQWGMSPEERKILNKYLLPLSGVADSQESVMMLVMDKNVADFDVVEANVLRKAIAKKKADILSKAKKLYFKKGKEQGTSDNLLKYIWEVQIGRQIGYSFSVLHTMGYSTIALQEMNLAYRFPIIYWNTACLTVNAGAINEEDYLNLIDDGIMEVSDAEDMRKSNKVQYGKIAAAIGKFRHDLGLTVDLPNINLARFGFTPDVDNNSIIFGMKAISRIGDDIIREIITRRPFDSLDDFITKMNEESGRKIVPVDRMVNLIKAGAFDKLEGKPREEIMKYFLGKASKTKTKLTLQNFNQIIDMGLVPKKLQDTTKLYKFVKYIRKMRHEEYYILDEVAEDYYFEEGFDVNKIGYFKNKEDENDIKVVPSDYIDKIYNDKMDDARLWLNKNQKRILEKYNEIVMKESWDKYASGDILTWELDALNFYHTGHELKGMGAKMPIVISSVDDIENEEVVGQFNFKGHTYPKYNIRHIIGTVLDSNKQKHLITLSTPEGVIMVKIYRSQYAKYDKVVSHTEDGKKVIDEESFFKKGTFLLVSGLKKGDFFVPKTYQYLKMDPIMRIEVNEKKEFVNAYGRI